MAPHIRRWSLICPYHPDRLCGRSFILSIEVVTSKWGFNDTAQWYTGIHEVRQNSSTSKGKGMVKGMVRGSLGTGIIS